MMQEPEAVPLARARPWEMSIGQSRPSPSRTGRDIFPLPVPPLAPVVGHFGRSTQQRLARRQRILNSVREAAKSLNWMNGCACEDFFEPDELQKEVLGRLYSLAVLAGDRGQEGPIPGEEASLREMLRGRTEYHTPETPVALAPFNLERISIPQSLEGAPEAAMLLDGEARQYLEVPQRMLLEDPKVETTKPYWDPRLLKDQRSYKSLVLKLNKLKYLNFTLSPCAEAGIFFVWKSDKQKIRMILDSRQANQLFRAPPGVELCSAEGFARLEVTVPESHHPGSPEFAKDLEGFGLYFGLSDIKDCFHRLRIPSWLSKYFALKPVPCQWVGLEGQEIEGKRLSRGDMVFPMAGSLPMGFSWSLFFAQKISEAQMQRIPELAAAMPMTDRGRPAVFHAPVPAGEKEASHYVYVDNLGVISPHQALVKSALGEMKGLFEAKGLVLHPGEIHHENVTALGCELRGDIMATRVTPKRFHKVRQSLRAVLRRKKVSGRLLEVVIGHATFCSLTCRPLLSIFNAVYKFIKAEYYGPAKLWITVREELEMFMGGMVFLQSDWWKQWNPLVACSDSSLSGYGVSTSFWPVETVAACGRIVERSRFRKLGAHSARDSALSSAGFVKDEITGLWKDRVLDDDEYLQLAGWSLDKEFEEVPAQLLRRELWTPRVWGKWDFSENIVVLEGRALVKSLKRIALTVFGSNIRQVLLVDNLSVALSFDRCRSRDFKLLKQIRKFCSYLLARNISASIRWVPSELNNSDIPSRYHSDEPSKLLTDRIPDVQAGAKPQAAVAPKGNGQVPKPEDSEPTGSHCPLVVNSPVHQLAGARPSAAPSHSKAVRPELQPYGGVFGGLGQGCQEEGQRAQFRERQHQCHRKPEQTQPSAAQNSSEESPSRGRRRHGKPDVRFDIPRTPSREQTNRSAVPPYPQGFRRICNPSWSELVGAYSTRPLAGAVPQQPVPSGPPGLPGRPVGGCSDARASGLWPLRRSEDPPHMAGHQRVQKTVPRQEQESISLGHLGRHCRPPEGEWIPSHGDIPSDGSLFVQSPIRTPSRPSDVLGPTCCRCNSKLVVAPLARGTPRTQQDRGIRHLSNAGFAMASSLGPQVFPGAEAESPRSAPVGFQLCRVHGPVQEGGLSARRGSHSVPDKAQWTLHRPGSPLPRYFGSAEKRTVEDSKIRGTIREECSIGSHLGCSPQAPQNSLPAVRGRPWGNPPRTQSGSHLRRRKVGVKGYVMDLFSGQGGVARACADLGFSSKEWDFKYGHQHDLTDLKVQKRIFSEVKRGVVLAVMMAPASTSFSVARDRAKVIRNRTYPWGLPKIFLTEAERDKVRAGNSIFRFCIQLVQLLLERKIPFILENPRSSKCWNLPAIRTLMADPRVHMVQLDFCQFGTPWKKPTSLMVGFLDRLDTARLAQAHCCGTGGLCSRTGKRHFLLTGTCGRTGTPWTQVAQQYPRKLCQSLAFCLTCPYHSCRHFFHSVL